VLPPVHRSRIVTKPPYLVSSCAEPIPLLSRYRGELLTIFWLCSSTLELPRTSPSATIVGTPSFHRYAALSHQCSPLVHLNPGLATPRTRPSSWGPSMKTASPVVPPLLTNSHAVVVAASALHAPAHAQAARCGQVSVGWPNGLGRARQGRRPLYSQAVVGYWPRLVGRAAHCACWAKRKYGPVALGFKEIIFHFYFGLN
jgi:hypothetical protein